MSEVDNLSANLANTSAASRELKSSYEAVFTYHHALVQSRFASTGLSLTLNSFLLAAYFTDQAKVLPPWLIPTLGVALTTLSFLLDSRTYHLLHNLISRGIDLERELGIDTNLGFFTLMKGPQSTPPTPERWRKVVSHSFVIESIHLILVSLWVFLPHFGR